jgi:hypothetical protein
MTDIENPQIKQSIFQSDPKNASDRAVLSIFLGEAADGAFILWLEIEQATGVKMNTRGKRMVVDVIRRTLNREVAVTRGTGITLSSKDSAVEHARAAVAKIIGATTRAFGVTRRLVDRHAEAMEQKDKERLISTRGMLGAVLTCSNDGVKMLKGA